MRNQQPGRHERGQNFLTDRGVIDRIVRLVALNPGPIVEWGTGNGAITLALESLGRPIEGIEIDPHRARDLSRRVAPHVCITEGDILRHAPPNDAVIVSNIPFHLTTPILRHLLRSPSWTHAVLIPQWEVARKRAGVGGTTQLTARWWPWFRFTLDRRIPSTAFRPRPNVDAGLLLIDRRADPLVLEASRSGYQSWVARVIGSRGRGIGDTMARQGVPDRFARDIERRRRGSRSLVLPRDLHAEDWAQAYRSTRRSHRSG